MRQEFGPLTLQFRETNTSFIDGVIRPWTILGSHAGLVKRNATNSIGAVSQTPTTNVTILQYTRSYQKLSQIPRKVWRFYNCLPVSVASRNLTYDAEQIDVYSSQWNFSHYEIVDNLYLPLPDLIDKLF